MKTNEIDIVRHEAIRLAVEACNGQPPARIMEFAKEIDAFLRGMASVPPSTSQHA